MEIYKGHSPKVVLLIEDNPADASLMREALHDINAPVRLYISEDGETGLRFLRREGEHDNAPAPALLLLDLNLPGVGGCEVLRLVRLDANMARLPIIVLSNSAAQSDVDAVYDLGGNCYMKKPTDWEDYVALMKNFEQFWLETARLPTVAGHQTHFQG